MKKQSLTIKELEREIPQGEAWVRKMEREGHLNFKSPKVRGQVVRLFDQGDVVNALYVSALNSVGYGPQKLSWYKETVKRFKDFGAMMGIFKKPSKDPVDQFFVFSTRDVFPDGDAGNIDWEILNAESGHPLLETLQALLVEAYVVRRITRNTRRTLNKVEKNLDEFINGLEEGMSRCMPGNQIVTFTKQLFEKNIIDKEG